MHIRFLDHRVEKELRELGKEAQAVLTRINRMMEENGTFALGLPHVRKIQHPLWEIRIKDTQGIVRALFVSVIKNEVLILHAFRKKTQQTPKEAIDLALKRLKEVL
jgi:phage-related protein